MEPSVVDDAIRRVLATRRPGSTACPSEVARLLDPRGWRELMPQVREAAGRLAEAGELAVTQGGEVVDVRAARGPVRLRPAAPAEHEA